MLLEPFAKNLKHFHWDRSFGFSDRFNCRFIDCWTPSRWPFARGRFFARQQLERLDLSWFLGETIDESEIPGIRAALGDPDLAYLVPLSEDDARRCRDIVRIVGCPFVIHLWDVLQGRIGKRDSAYEWLLRRARHVFCVSDAILEETLEVTDRASLMPFVRPSPTHRARWHPSASPLIAVVGDVTPYEDGMHLLADAVEQMRRSGIAVRVRHIGSPMKFLHSSKRLKTTMDRLEIDYFGHVEDKRRDELLADCHVAYLPGPMRPSDASSRSKYSIPSRVADYLGVGLPIVAAVNPLSSTASFMSEISGAGFFGVATVEEIRQVLSTLESELQWVRAQRGCLEFFETRIEITAVRPRFVDRISMSAKLDGRKIAGNA
jgi:glycosyltransferase involved in cell wall biosynthesis